MDNISSLIKKLEQVFKKDYLSIFDVESGVGYFTFANDLNRIHKNVKNHIISSSLTLDDETYKKYSKGVSEIISKIEIEEIILNENALQILLENEYNYYVTTEELKKSPFLEIRHDTWLYSYADLRAPQNQLEIEQIVKINQVLINYSKKRILNELDKELHKTIKNNTDFFINDDIRTKFHSYRKSADLNIFPNVSFLFQKLSNNRKLSKCTHYEFATWLFENSYCKKSSYEIFKEKGSYTRLAGCSSKEDRRALFKKFFNF